MWTAVKSIFVVLLTKTNNRPIISDADNRPMPIVKWPIPIIGKLADIIGRYRLSAYNRCTSSKFNSIQLKFSYIPEVTHLAECGVHGCRCFDWRHRWRHWHRVTSSEQSAAVHRSSPSIDRQSTRRSCTFIKAAWSITSFQFRFTDCVKRTK